MIHVVILVRVAFMESFAIADLGKGCCVCMETLAPAAPVMELSAQVDVLFRLNWA